ATRAAARDRPAAARPAESRSRPLSGPVPRADRTLSEVAEREPALRRSVRWHAPAVRRGVRGAAVCALVACAFVPAHAQTPDPTNLDGVVRVLDRMGQFVVQAEPPEPPLAQRPLEPLQPEQVAALRNAQSLRESGLLDEASHT